MKKKIIIAVVFVIVMIGLIVFPWSGMKKDLANGNNQSIENSDQVIRSNINDSEGIILPELDDNLESDKTIDKVNNSDDNLESDEVIDKEYNSDDNQESDEVINNEYNSDDKAGNHESDSGITDSIFDDSPTSTVKPTDPSKPEETKKPEQTVPPNNNPTESDELDYMTFQNMEPSEQEAYMESFEDIEAFFDWYNAVKEKYELENPPIEVDGGVIDIGKIIEEEN